MIMRIMLMICPNGAGMGNKDTQYAMSPKTTIATMIDNMLFKLVNILERHFFLILLTLRDDYTS